MSKYITVDWEILEVTHLGQTYHKVFASTKDRDMWRMNSGITSVKKQVYFPDPLKTDYHVFGYSGSEYVLTKGQYGIGVEYNKPIISNILEYSRKAGYQIKRLQEDEAYKILDTYLG